jgi:hypothetical protein
MALLWGAGMIVGIGIGSLLFELAILFVFLIMYFFERE